MASLLLNGVILKLFLHFRALPQRVTLWQKWYHLTMMCSFEDGYICEYYVEFKARYF